MSFTTHLMATQWTVTTLDNHTVIAPSSLSLRRQCNTTGQDDIAPSGHRHSTDRAESELNHYRGITVINPRIIAMRVSSV